jgi:hypothetical protein
MSARRRASDGRQSRMNMFRDMHPEVCIEFIA